MYTLTYMLTLKIFYFLPGRLFFIKISNCPSLMQKKGCLDIFISACAIHMYQEPGDSANSKFKQDSQVIPPGLKPKETR